MMHGQTQIKFTAKHICTFVFLYSLQNI